MCELSIKTLKIQISPNDTAKRKKSTGKQGDHIVIFINAEISRQVLVLLLADNQHAWERVRKRGRDGERFEDVKRRKDETDGKEEWGWGRFFGGVSHCELSAAIILLRHLRQGMPHPGAHASVAHGNCSVVYVCEHAREHVCVA